MPMCERTIQILTTLSLLSLNINGARILCVFTVPSLSHHIVYRALTAELARSGHDLVVVTSLPFLPKDRPADKVREIDLQNRSFDIIKKTLPKVSMKEMSMKTFHNIILKANTEIIDSQLDAHEVKELIQNSSETFDLIIVECVIRPTFFYTHRFKAPVIGISSMLGLQYVYGPTGTPSHPILYPDMFRSKIGNLTFWDKVEAVYVDLWQKHAYWSSSEDENIVGRRHFGEDTPDIRELVRNMGAMFVNVNALWAGVRPVPPGVHYLGGLHLRPKQKLTEEWQNYLDGCSRGVVYMSLGSNIKSAGLPAERVQMFLSAFGDLEYCVLWKWEADEPAGKPENVRLAKWLPQADILRHHQIRAFITQGGLQSTDEAIEAEVPLVGIPFMCDQEQNVQKYVLHGIGVALHLETLSAAVLRDAVLQVAEDERYKQNTKKLKRLINDHPMGSLERAAWWTEYLLRHGSAAHLRSPSAGASLADTCALDVLAALAAAALLAACLVAATLRRLRNLIARASLNRF